MRRFLISALILSLLAGCSSFRFGPHRIDVQQGNALDQENVARLKLGLNRSQVRFLLGTPLLVDPFHNDRWDYVYVYYKAGKLSEQRRISLFFDGETLVRIEGDMPAAESAAQAPAPTPAARPEPQAATPAAPDANQKPVPQAEPAAAPAAKSEPAAVKALPVAAATAAPAKAPTAEAAKVPTAAPTKAATAVPAAVPAAAPAASAKTSTTPPNRTVSAATSVVQPLSSPKGAASYKDPHPAAELSLQPETDVEQIKSDVMPSFPEPAPVAVAAVNEDAVLKAVNAWASAWARRDDEAYIAAYDADFIPQDGGSHADWVKRRRMLLEVAKNIDVRIESLSVDRADDGTVKVTFNQFYRSDNYRDKVVKQLRMTERDGRWLIVDEKVVSVLHKAKP